MKLLWKFCGLMLLLVVIYRDCDGKLVDLEGVTIRKWNYLTKFAFWSNEGQINIRIVLPKYFNATLDKFEFNINPQLVIVVDNEVNWDTLYRDNYNHPSMPCEKSLSDLLGVEGTVQKDLKYISEQWSGNESVIFNVENKLFVESSNSELYTFINLFMCDISDKEYLTKKMDINLELHNGNKDNVFRYQISADHYYIYETLIFLVVAYFFMFIIIYYYNKKMTSSSRYTPITFMISLVVVFKFIIYICQLIIMIAYSQGGKFSYSGFVAFEFFNILTIIIFMEVILCLAFGLTIQCGKLPYVLVIFNTVLGIVYALITVLSIIISMTTFTDATTIYIYGNYTGYVLVAIQLCVAIEFIVGCCLMLRKFSKSRVFYGVFLFVGTVWILSVPVLVLFANLLIKTYLKFSVVVITRNLIDLFGHLVFLILTYPGLLSELVVYTTPPDKVANTKFEDMQEISTDDFNTSNNEFFDISEFQ